MKKLFLLLFATSLCFVVFAQEEDEFTKMMKEMYKQEFVDVINENMNLTEDQNIAFQPILNEFITEMENVSSLRIKNQRRFSEYFKGITNEQADEIMKNASTNTKKWDNLSNKYYKKVKKQFDAKTGLRFYLIVSKIQNLLDYSVIQDIPLVENK